MNQDVAKEIAYLFISNYYPNSNFFFEKEFIRMFYQRVGDAFTVFSLNESYTEETKIEEKDFSNLEILKITDEGKPIIRDYVKMFKFSKLLSLWCDKNKQKTKIVILMNAPYEIIRPLLKQRKKHNYKMISYAIDTAIGNILHSDVFYRNLLNKRVKIRAILAEKMLRKADGIIVLNENVIKKYNIKKPYLLSKVGIDINNFSLKNKIINEKKIILYAGTLIYYDGTVELLEAFTKLDKDSYELRIYGKGPLLNICEDYAQKYKNIKIFNLLPREEIMQEMHNADLLVNPRIAGNATDIFGFPSKMIEYLFSGTPVLTTCFPALPIDFKKFVFLIENETSDGIAEGIQKVFSKNILELENAASMAKQYIIKNYEYIDVFDEMYKFINQIGLDNYEG